MAGGGAAGVTPALGWWLACGSLRVSRVSSGRCGSRERRRGQLRRGLRLTGSCSSLRPEQSAGADCIACVEQLLDRRTARESRAREEQTFSNVQRERTRGSRDMCMDVCSPLHTSELQMLCANLVFDVAARLHVMLVWECEAMHARSATADARDRMHCHAVPLVVMRV